MDYRETAEAVKRHRGKYRGEGSSKKINSKNKEGTTEGEEGGELLL
jgi:hypothetical protein